MADEKKTNKSEKKPEKKSDKKKANPFKAIVSFFKSVRSEGKKVVWPNAKEVWKSTLVVLVVILIVGVVIYGIDFGLTSGMKALKGLKENETTTEATTANIADALSNLTQADDKEATTDAPAETESTTDAAD